MELFELIVLFENAETWYGVFFRRLVRMTFCFRHCGMGMTGWNDAGGEGCESGQVRDHQSHLTATHLPVFHPRPPPRNSCRQPAHPRFAFLTARLAAKSRVIPFTMTVFLPLQGSTATPPLPSFLCTASEPTDYLKRVIKAILKAKHIAVVCGEHLGTTYRFIPHPWVECSCLAFVTRFRGWNIRSSWHSRFSFIRWPFSNSEEG